MTTGIPQGWYTITSYHHHHQFHKTRIYIWFRLRIFHLTINNIFLLRLTGCGKISNIYFVNMVAAASRCLECLEKQCDCHSWDTLAAVSPPFTEPATRLTLMMFNTRVTTIKATIRREPTIHSDHNASRPPTEAGTTYSTYQSSNRTSALRIG